MTWELINLPPNKHPIIVKWVYKVKIESKWVNNQMQSKASSKGLPVKEMSRLFWSVCTSGKGWDHKASYGLSMSMQEVDHCSNLMLNLHFSMDL